MISDIPQKFKDRYADLIDDEQSFFDALNSFQPRSFRVNTIKTNRDKVKEKFKGYGIKLTEIPCYEDAFISEEPDIGSTFEHFLGNIYMQELVSMLPPLLVKEELKNAKAVLDACAAPGSKTTQLAAMMENKNFIVANDISYKRTKALKFNLEKTGVLNTVVTNRDLRNFPKEKYDLILLDAPCSSEGTMRKNYGLFSIWSERHIHSLARAQKQLIVKAFDLLNPGGTMVYSTCTFAPEENEMILDHLIQERPAIFEKIEIPNFKLSPILKEWNKTEFNSEIKGARIWPHHNDTGGFFLAKVKK